MKLYQNDVKLKHLKATLDRTYFSKELDNKEIIERRWKQTERALKKAQPHIQALYRSLKDDIISLLKEIDFDYSKLSQNVPDRVKRIVNERKNKWKNPYLLYLATTHNWTYRSVLKLLICSLYASKYEEIKEISQDVFVISAVDTYSQSVADRGIKDAMLLSLATILSFAVMPVIQNTYDEYLDSLLISQVDEMESFILISQMNVSIDENSLLKVLIKQSHRILYVNEDKYSGGLEDAVRVVSNSAYTYDTKPDQQVRFVAEMDEKTTRMCRSLNNQIFYTNKENVFKRYSAQNNAIIEVKCNGLVQGLNMPPISDHFHWCRSTLTYQITVL